MNRNELRIRELEKEIVETNACISEVQSNVSQLPVGDPERISAHKLIWRLMETRTVAFRALCALVNGVELRAVRH
jgi:hypothetical protein